MYTKKNKGLIHYFLWADRCSACLRKSSFIMHNGYLGRLKPHYFKHPPPLDPFYRFYFWPWFHVVWGIPLFFWDQLPQPCPHPFFLLTPSVLTCEAETETENALMFYKHCSAVSKTPKYYQHCFCHKFKHSTISLSMKKIHSTSAKPTWGAVQSEKRKCLDDLQALFRNNENIALVTTLL